MRKYCDLNVKVTSSFQENVDNVKRLIELGYQSVAISFDHPKLEKPEKQEKGKKRKKEKKESAESKIVLEMKTLMTDIKSEIYNYKESMNDFSVPDNFQLLTRVNITISHNDEIFCFKEHFFHTIFKEFDLISIYPQNEKVFNMLMEGKVPVDILSFPLEHKLDFRISHEMAGSFIKKGIYFEICYAQVIKSQSLRKYILKNGRELLSKTKQSKGIVISSGGEHQLDFRSPLDVVNLSDLFTVKGASCYDVVEANAQRVINHSLTRRKTFVGAVMVEKIEIESDSKNFNVSFNSNEPDIKKKKDVE